MNVRDTPPARPGEFRTRPISGRAHSQSCRRRGGRRLAWGCLLLLALAGVRLGHAQDELPDAPVPQVAAAAGTRADGSSSLPEGAVPEEPAGQQAFPPEARPTPGLSVPGLQPTYVPLPRWCVTHACSEASHLSSCCNPVNDAFGSYLRQNAIHVYTPGELGKIAVRGVIDPFNLMTIGATSLFTVGTDPHSQYGPGFKGWSKLSGITLTEDMTGEFVGTFLIPAIDHQDPHYHRTPNASMTRRILHSSYQPFWTTSDTGKGMINYSTIVGSIVTEAVNMSYVPYQQEGWGPGAARIAVGWASTPVGNYVTEFFPDVARHINLKVVFLQRIVNRVALENGGP